ncbi:sulfotransferase 1B1-like [Ptychodera flava]|uniref:sulfotransferase 1B1-like n=1 Tax=Ptychodera flava TaxID=63121 RepID=UPI00396A495B
MSKAEEAYKGMTPRKRFDTYVYERTGHTMPWHIPASTLDAMYTFEVREDDVFLITYPKSGTTLLRKIIALVMNNADEELIDGGLHVPFSRKIIYSEFNSLEDREPMYKKFERMECRRFIPTHLPPSLLPRQLFEKPAKVIYVARNPKDSAVSYFHHHMKSPLEVPYNWQDYLRMYLSKDMRYVGEWGSHVIPWWKKRNEQNVLFLKYEDIVKDLGQYIRKIAAFLEQDHLTNEKFDKIVKLCTFDNMKKDPVDTAMILSKAWKYDISSNPFVREGKIGGWKEYFTEEQNTQFDQVYKRWIGDSGLEMEFSQKESRSSSNSRNDVKDFQIRSSGPPRSKL